MTVFRSDHSQAPIETIPATRSSARITRIRKIAYDNAFCGVNFMVSIFARSQPIPLEAYILEEQQ
jgi:hypothetical protein